MNTSTSNLLQNTIKQDRCKILIKSEPQLEELTIALKNNATQQYTKKQNGTIEISLFYPSQMNDFLCVMAFDHELIKIDLDKIRFDKLHSSSKELTQEKTYQAVYMGQQVEINVYFELQLSGDQQQQDQQQQQFLTIDISCSGIPIKQKCFSCFPSVPLAFYEILSLNTNQQQSSTKIQQEDSLSPQNNNNDNLLYQSEITRLPSQDPVWMPSKKLNQQDLQPAFRVNVYNSSDHLKSRQQLIGGCDIDYQTVVDGKEFMFEMEGLENTHVLIDRIQIVQ